MSFFGDLIGNTLGGIPFVGGPLEAGFDAIAGGGGGDQPKPTPYLGKTIPGQTPDHVVTYVLQRMSTTERMELDQLWYAANPHKPTLPVSNPWDIAHSIAGGNDGRVGSKAGRDLQSFWNRMVSKYPVIAAQPNPTYGAPSQQPEAPLLGGGFPTAVGPVATAGGDGSSFPVTGLLLAGAAVGLVIYATR